MCASTSFQPQFPSFPPRPVGLPPPLPFPPIAFQHAQSGRWSGAGAAFRHCCGLSVWGRVEFSAGAILNAVLFLCEARVNGIRRAITPSTSAVCYQVQCLWKWIFGDVTCEIASKTSAFLLHSWGATLWLNMLSRFAPNKWDHFYLNLRQYSVLSCDEKRCHP